MAAQTKKKGEIIRELILNNVSDHPEDINPFVSAESDLDRKTVTYHLTQLVKKGLLKAEGSTRNRIFTLNPVNEHTFTGNCSQIEEQELYISEFYPFFRSQKDEVEVAWNHGITEMLNNVKDHSDGAMFEVFMQQYKTHSFVRISDDGVGIFNKIMQDQNIDSIEDAVIKLSIGGRDVSSDPENHAGEGIFFTSKLLDMFCIISEGVVYEPSDKKFSDFIKDKASPNGTHVLMQHWNNSVKSYTEVFGKHTITDEDGIPNLRRTTIPVASAMLGGRSLISRSQAKRLTAGLKKFSEVEFDFKDVEVIGQGFSDQLFRVFASASPDTKIMWENANETVQKMIMHTTINAKNANVVCKPNKATIILSKPDITDDKRLLFARHIKELEKKLLSNDAYELLDAADIIFKLFLDGNGNRALVNQIGLENKLIFKIADPDQGYSQVLRDLKPDSWSVQDGLCPRLALTQHEVIEVDKSKLFNTAVMGYKNQDYTVREVIKFITEVLDSRHAYEPKDEKQEALIEITSKLGDIRLTLRTIIGIGNVILDTTKPLLNILHSRD